MSVCLSVCLEFEVPECSDSSLERFSAMGTSKLTPAAVSEHRQSHLFMRFSIFCSTSWPALCCQLLRDTLLSGRCKQVILELAPVPVTFWDRHLGWPLGASADTVCRRVCVEQELQCWKCFGEFVIHFCDLFVSMSSNKTQSAHRVNASSLCAYRCRNP